MKGTQILGVVFVICGIMLTAAFGPVALFTGHVLRAIIFNILGGIAFFVGMVFLLGIPQEQCTVTPAAKTVIDVPHVSLENKEVTVSNKPQE